MEITELCKFGATVAGAESGASLLQAATKSGIEVFVVCSIVAMLWRILSTVIGQWTATLAKIFETMQKHDVLAGERAAQLAQTNTQIVQTLAEISLAVRGPMMCLRDAQAQINDAAAELRQAINKGV